MKNGALAGHGRWEPASTQDTVLVTLTDRQIQWCVNQGAMLEQGKPSWADDHGLDKPGRWATGLKGECAIGLWLRDEDIEFRYVPPRPGRAQQTEFWIRTAIAWVRLEVKTLNVPTATHLMVTEHQGVNGADVLAGCRLESERDVRIMGWISARRYLAECDTRELAGVRSHRWHYNDLERPWTLKPAWVLGAAQ